MCNRANSAPKIQMSVRNKHKTRKKVTEAAEFWDTVDSLLYQVTAATTGNIVSQIRPTSHLDTGIREL